MSDDDRTHFKFDQNGIHIELTGDRQFVEQMYRQIMRDIEANRPAPEESDGAEPQPASSDRVEASDAQPPSDRPHALDVVWVIRAGDMMRRIYMADLQDFAASPLVKTLKPEHITTLYVDKPTMSELLDDLPIRRDTLWAELTDAGRRRLAESDG